MLFSAEPKPKVRSVTTTVLFPVDLIDRIDQSARLWAVEKGFSPHRSRNKWIVALLREALDSGKGAKLKVGRKELAESIHEMSAKIHPQMKSWEDTQSSYRGQMLELADYLLEIFSVYRKEEDEKTENTDETEDEK